MSVICPKIIHVSHLPEMVSRTLVWNGMLNCSLQGCRGPTTGTQWLVEGGGGRKGGQQRGGWDFSSRGEELFA